MGDCVVYWLYDAACVCPWHHGYVGRSARWNERLVEHRCRRSEPFQWQILFRGTRKECVALEWELRPHAGIGWNRSIGGKPSVDHTEIVREKLRFAGKHRVPISEATREKLRIANIGRTNRGRIGQKKSDIERAKIAASHRGKKHSKQFSIDLSARMKGKQYHLGFLHSEQTKEQIRKTKTGVAVHSDEHKQKLAERMKGNSYTKGKPWSAARRQASLQKQEV
jgi:hypothetical protein